MAMGSQMGGMAGGANPGMPMGGPMSAGPGLPMGGWDGRCGPSSWGATGMMGPMGMMGPTGLPEGFFGQQMHPPPPPPGSHTALAIADGQDGKNGKNGKNRKNGKDGKNCKNGKDGAKVDAKTKAGLVVPLDLTHPVEEGLKFLGYLMRDCEECHSLARRMGENRSF